MRRVIIVTPAPRGATSGNRVTALRWAVRLRELGNTVAVDTEWRGEPYDVIVALHARKSHASIVAFARAHPSAPRVLALTGTDVYGELDASARESLALAHRIVVLQPLAAREVPDSRVRVIRQSARAPREIAPQPDFTVCALAHMREVKDPLLAARAAALLPANSHVRVIHLGAADEAWAARAREAEQTSDGRWRWLGPHRRRDALAILAGSRALVLTSRTEGGANVVTEAIAAGVPVISTRIAGSLGILGEDYPAYVEPGDAAALATLLSRCEREPEFLDELRARVHALQPLVDPVRERDAWRALLAELS